MPRKCIHCHNPIRVSYDHAEDCPDHPENDTVPTAHRDPSYLRAKDGTPAGDFGGGET